MLGKKFRTIVLMLITFMFAIGSNLSAATKTSDVGTKASIIPAGTVRIHYKRTTGDYNNWTVWAWNDAEGSSTWPVGVEKAGTDTYGVYYDIKLKSANPKSIGFLFVNKVTGDKDEAAVGGGDRNYQFLGSEKELWCTQGSTEIKAVKPSNIVAGKFRIHYKRTNSDYKNWTVWAWEDAVGSATWPSGVEKTGTDADGVYYDITLKDAMKKVGFLLVNSSTGDKDEADKTFQLVTAYNEVWVFQGDNGVYITRDKIQPLAIYSGSISGVNKLEFGFTIPESVVIADLKITDKDKTVLKIDKLVAKNGKVIVDAKFDLTKLPLEATYKGKTIVIKVDGAGFIDAMYSYDGGDLGATYHSGEATLKLWTPLATQVVVDVYSSLDQNKVVKSGIAMTKGAKGIWSVTLNKTNTGLTDLHGYFYQYRVTNDGVEKVALDPYAKSMAEFNVNSQGAGSDKTGKAAIIDPAKVTVSGLNFAKLPTNWKREDALIWEIQVRDFTSQEGVALKNQFGTYNAFKEKLQYLKELGVTHIQLLPIMASYYGDESKAGTRETEWLANGANYNWGYDPHNYFSPDGMFATDRTNASARIIELKEMIKAIHDAGMAVTLDVVYNHNANTEIMNSIAPGYYYRAGGNASGCGNDTASENAMMRKIIVDSLVYWTNEYKVDGFRFDLMGIIDTETVQKGYDEVAKVNPNTLFIGEGWKMYSGPAGTKGADQDWMTSTDSVGVFSDEIRNELKSGYGSEGFPRFLTNGARNISTIFKNIKAQPVNFGADDSGDVVQYIEAHDNLTLHDVITQSLITPKEKGSTLLPATELTETQIHKRIRLGNAMILTSQGIAFMHAGQEYGRTKEWKGTDKPTREYTEVKDQIFIHNSYDSSDVVNNIDWKNLMNTSTLQNATMKYTKGLIALRNSTDAFRLGTKELVDLNVNLLYPSASEKDKIIAFSSKATNGDTYYVIINADTNARDFKISGMDTGTVLVDNDESGITPVTNITGIVREANKVTVAPLTVIIIKK